LQIVREYLSGSEGGIEKNIQANGIGHTWALKITLPEFLKI
jgi:hypothetical protein